MELFKAFEYCSHLDAENSISQEFVSHRYSISSDKLINYIANRTNMLLASVQFRGYACPLGFHIQDVFRYNWCFGLVNLMQELQFVWELPVICLEATWT